MRRQRTAKKYVIFRFFRRFPVQIVREFGRRMQRLFFAGLLELLMTPSRSTIETPW